MRAAFSIVFTCVMCAVHAQSTRGGNPPAPRHVSDTIKFIPPVVTPEPVQLIDGDTVFNSYSVETTAEYPGGMQEFYLYLHKNLKYPTERKDSHVQGKVVLDAVVEKTGKISHVSVKNTTHSAFDEEAIRVLSNSGNWIPGKRKGKNVHSRIRIPIYINWK